MNNRPQSRPSLSLIASLPYCVCCLCGQDHSTPDCPPPSPQQPNHSHVCNLYTTYDDDPAEDPVPNSLALPEHTWRALHWDVWNSQDPLDPIPPPKCRPILSHVPLSPQSRRTQTPTPSDIPQTKPKYRRSISAHHHAILLRRLYPTYTPSIHHYS